MQQSDSATNQITLYQQAKTILAEYKTVDEVKDFRDKALAIEVYAKQANDMELEWDAARARVRAERKCGELLAQMERGKGNQHTVAIPDNGEQQKSQYSETLDRAGISTQQSSNYQKLAAVPEEEFEKAVENPAAKPSTSHIIKPKETEPKRMNKDALYVWGVLREFRSRRLFEVDLSFLVEEWTGAMQEDALSIIPKLKKWVDNYE
jgi:hypothetical protein